MARGWESKSIESQIEAAQAGRGQAPAPAKTPEQIVKEQEMAKLEMSRNRVANDLAASNNPRYRELLQRSLDFLDERLRELRGNDPAE
jgi:hypothetical protein